MPKVMTKPKAPATGTGSRKPTRAAAATLTINSRNYGAWSLRGWLICKFAGLDFEEIVIPTDDAASRAELLLLSPSFRVPCLEHDGIRIWDTLAIAAYLDELKPEAGLLPKDRAARAHCRSICGEMHSGFVHLRTALPMNLKAHRPGFLVWAGARADIERILSIWHECISTYGGPFLFGSRPCLADAMFAPVCTRLLTYDVAIDPVARAYCRTIMEIAEMQEWVAAAQAEPEEVMELDVEF